MVGKAQHLVSQGFRAIKMQAGHLFDRHTDLANIRRMRESLGPSVEIMVDVNRGWSADEAIRIGRKFQDYDIYWLEEPVPAEDFAGYLRTPTRWTCASSAARATLPATISDLFWRIRDCPSCSPTGSRRTDGTAQDRGDRGYLGMDIAPHLYHELMVQVMASIPNGIWLEYMGWLDDLWWSQCRSLTEWCERPSVPDMPRLQTELLNERLAL